MWYNIDHENNSKESNSMMRFQDERDIDRYVEEILKNIGLVFKEDFNDQRNMSDYLKSSLEGSSKTENKTGMGIPDFSIEKYQVPVIIENKVKLDKLLKTTKEGGISLNNKDVQSFAVNGAVSYARHMIHSGKYDSVVAIGIAGDTDENLTVAVYYVFGFEGEPKLMSEYTTLGFLENKNTFDTFINNAVLTEKEKYEILFKSQEELHYHANKLNKLMNDHSIGVAERVIYVSGMLLSMQDIENERGEVVLEGLCPRDISGKQTDEKRDGVKILSQIADYLTNKGVPDNKKRLMLSSFSRISIDADRDKPTELSPSVSKSIKEKKASITRQVFQYLYDNIFIKIAGTAGNLDIIGDMYSIFLKYALGDGKEIGIVLTPSYVTKLMAHILGIDKDSKVLDVAAGSAGFLISCMEIMIEQANKEYGKGTTEAHKKINEIKNTQLMGIERDSQMYTLAATNMIMRGDGSAKIEKGSSFELSEGLYNEFGATALLLNPPFTYSEHGMPFLALGLRHMKKDIKAKAAIIIQDSAGSGMAVNSNKEILKEHRLLASIKMPGDLFLPYAGVQTSIYIFEAGTPHNFKTDVVKFIDLRQDGYKRTKRRTYEVDSPNERYADIPIIFHMGFNADKNPDFHKELWILPEIYVEDTITENGADWNFEQHKKIDITPTKTDFSKTVGDYLSWEANQLIKSGFQENEVTDRPKK
jgi:type I restriction-modification system DNA methylase subunit